MKSKKTGIIIGAVFVIIASPFVVQFGWNEIVTTIVPVGKITVWQALGMDALLSFIFPCCKEQYFKNHYMCIFNLVSQSIYLVRFGGNG